MSATTLQSPNAASSAGDAGIGARFSARWIINQRDDLVWFIGSVASSYLLLALYTSGLLPLGVMLLSWAILLDAPHVFATFSRTYFDREERRSRARLLWGSLAFFLVGPAMVLLDRALVFFFLAALWAYYHLVKQHYGFMVLYKKKNDDLAKIDNALDRALLLLAFAAPFALFVATDAEAQARVPVGLMNFVSGLARMLVWLTAAVGVLWLARQVQRLLRRQPLDIPKYLLLLAAIPMHWIVLLMPMPAKPLAIVAILTIYHNLQYHRLVWFHNKKYAKGDDRRARYGAAELISRRLIYYALFGILFGIMYRLPQSFFGGAYTRDATISAQLMVAFLWGFAFIHYYLDSKIWRVRRDANVGKALHIEGAA